LSHGIIGADEIVRQMGVQALHPDPGAAHSPARLDEVAANGGRASAPGIVIVCSLKVVCIDERLESVDSAFTFETTHGVVQLGINEPIQSGHGRAIAQMWFVLDHHRASVSTPHYDRETSTEGTADQSFNETLIGERRVAKRQRQNSSVRTKRDTNPWPWWCVEVF
jgi:hypothetical protein